MFIAYNKVRMHDTDMAGILYFASQFRFVHEALEDIFEREGYPFDALFQRDGFLFVIVHAEADYLAHLKVGDPLEVHVSVEKMGTTSIAFGYHIYCHKLVGKAKTVHVCLDQKSCAKITIPDAFRQKFSKYLQQHC